jgi:hypothetical protein
MNARELAMNVALSPVSPADDAAAAARLIGATDDDARTRHVPALEAGT